MSLTPSPFLAPSEAAQLLGVTRAAVARMARLGKLPAVRVGRNWAIPREAVEELSRTYRKHPGGRPKRQPTGGET